MQPWESGPGRHSISRRETIDAGRRLRALTILALVLACAGTALVTGRASASAAPMAAGAASDMLGRSAAVDVVATTIRADPEDFSGTGYATVAGSKAAGNGVAVVIGADTELCTVPGDSRTTWTCGRLLLPNGAGIELTATETPLSGVAAPPAGTVTLDVLGPPQLDGTGSYLTTGLVAGTGFAGASVVVSIDGVVDAGCSGVVVQPSTLWSCRIEKASGGPFVVRAQQSSAQIANGSLSDYSNVQQVTVDRDVPAAPVILSPGAGSTFFDQHVSVSGTGEDGATLDVYVDNLPTCSTTVAGSTWTCAVGGLSIGAHTLRAVQRDYAGNYAPPGDSIGITISRRAATPSPTPSTPPAPIPAPESTSTPDAAPTPSAPQPSAPAPGPGSDAPFGPGAAPQGSGDVLTNWGTPTGFASGLTTVEDSLARGSWFTAPLIALVFLALIALPLRMLATALRGRMRRSPAQFTGRNRNPLIDTAPVPSAPVNPWLAGAAAVAAVAALVALSGGVDGEVRYLRLYLAIGLGIGILNFVGAAVATRVTGRWIGVERRLRFLPVMLVAALVTAVISRWTGIDPPVITGVIIGAAIVPTAPVRKRAVVNLVQIGTVTALGVVGWLALGLLRPTDGFWVSAVSEVLATVCLAGLGSALVLALPVGSLPGRVVLEWSAPAWVATILVVSTIAAAVIFGDVRTSLALLPSAMMAAAFAALCVAVWAYVRFVEREA